MTEICILMNFNKQSDKFLIQKYPIQIIILKTEVMDVSISFLYPETEQNFYARKQFLLEGQDMNVYTKQTNK